MKKYYEIGHFKEKQVPFITNCLFLTKEQKNFFAGGRIGKNRG